nr:hypothetical protein [uncultured Oscillibacter sp.]
MNIIDGLQSKNNQEAYQLLLLLEQRSAESGELYGCFEDFIGLLTSKRSFVQVRGFRLACAQARWDTEGKLLGSLDALFAALYAAKPAAVRQCLSALQNVLRRRAELAGEILSRLEGLDLSRYKDTMRPLIEQDLQTLRALAGPSVP